ncbi:hypothetical protein HC031_15055 [Planosporangium thailandense]|uniref:Uncharacterized protein n=1 Tax=Planosporangium thailandense TaxID=765197 RepID=A0ABX0Y0M2_9ACTN|nr:hypothetical protein [Planosporangium thailandense]NJC71022.1 hypothetical protein [Planosporangium thailandense]
MTTVVVAVSAVDAVESPAEAATALADLAVDHEVAMVYGYDPATPFRLHRLLHALRTRLPRFRFVAVFVDPHPDTRPVDCDLLGELVNDGAFALAVVPAPDPTATAAAVAACLAANAVLRLEHDRARGVLLRTLGEPTSRQTLGEPTSR